MRKSPNLVTLYVTFKVCTYVVEFRRHFCIMYILEVKNELKLTSKVC
jgi:hypothetical protein